MTRHAGIGPPMPRGGRLHALQPIAYTGAYTAAPLLALPRALLVFAIGAFALIGGPLTVLSLQLGQCACLPLVLVAFGHHSQHHRPPLLLFPLSHGLGMPLLCSPPPSHPLLFMSLYTQCLPPLVMHSQPPHQA